MFKKLLLAIILVIMSGMGFNSARLNFPHRDSLIAFVSLKAMNIKGNTIQNYPVLDQPLLQKDRVMGLYPKDSVLLFAYGSLLNINSASRTISDKSISTYTPAVAFGLQRLFDRDVPESENNWGTINSPLERGMLNVRYDGDPSHVVNGVLMVVNDHDLEKLIERETGYELIPIPVMLWDQAINKSNAKPTIVIAYTFSAKENSPYVDHQVIPVTNYAIASEMGAAQYGDEFLRFWQQTTYLADGKTPYMDWKNSIKNS